MTSQFVSCPDCHVLVADTLEERREHRAADRQNRQVIEAVRRLARLAADDASGAVQLVRDLQRDLEGLDGRVREAADTPEPDPVIVRTWPEDELDDPDEQQSQYADDYTEADHDEDEQPEDEDKQAATAAGNIRAFHPNDYFTGPGAA